MENALVFCSGVIGDVDRQECLSYFSSGALTAAPAPAPTDAPWGERYFHLRDPDGHELSFAKLLG